MYKKIIGGITIVGVLGFSIIGGPSIFNFNISLGGTTPKNTLPESPRSTSSSVTTPTVTASLTDTKLDTSDASTSEPANKSIDIPAIVSIPNIIEPISTKSLVTEEPDVLIYSGNIIDENQQDYYDLTPTTSGRYRFDISGMAGGTSVQIYVFNSLGEKIDNSSSISNGNGITLSLNAGEIYLIQVRQYSGTSEYKLSIGQQKSVVDISKFTEVTDSIQYTDQRNIYDFTPTVSGRYRFDISGMTGGTSIQIYVFNSLGEKVDSSIGMSNDNGITLTLDAEETYEIQVRQSSGMSVYKLSIGQQKSVVDISQVTEVTDSIQYTDQHNIYDFMPTISGRYRFDISGMTGGTSVQIYVFNSLQEKVDNSTGISNGSGITLNLNAGEKYEIQIRQSSGTSTYKMSIGYQKPVVDISQVTEVTDSIQYTDQRNIYDFTPTTSGKYLMDISGMTGGASMQIYVFNSLEEKVNNSSSISNGDWITLNLNAGETYEIQVRQSSGMSAYRLTIFQT